MTDKTNAYKTDSQEWRNATITHVDFSIERGFVTPTVTLDGGGWGVNFGGVVIGPGANDWVLGVMRCAGVERWSKMVGRNVRALHCGLGCSVRVIAHITDDGIVFDQDEWAADLRERVAQ